MAEVQNNENRTVCAACGGKCCKNYGGLCHPDDIHCDGDMDVAYKNIKQMLDSGMYSIDWLEACEESKWEDVYFIRMRHVGSEVVDPAYHGKCVNLTPTGCKLPFEERAYGCKSLIPNENRACGEGTYTKYDAAEDWMPYQEILKKLKSEYPEPVPQSPPLFLGSLLGYLSDL